MGEGVQGLGPSFVAFPGILAGNWTGYRAAGTQTGTLYYNTGPQTLLIEHTYFLW